MRLGFQTYVIACHLKSPGSGKVAVTHDVREAVVCLLNGNLDNYKTIHHTLAPFRKMVPAQPLTSNPRVQYLGLGFQNLCLP